MQAQSTTLSPDIQLMSLDKAEKKAELLENELTQINSEWLSMIDQVQKQTEHFMSENEMKEFQARISVLKKELNDKTNQIEMVAKEKKGLEQTEGKVHSLQLEIGDHQEEIDQLNLRYQDALRDKVQVYEELIECVRELIKRNSNFVQNEMEIGQMQNQCTILKRQLEQKEKMVDDLRSQELFTQNP